MASLRSFLPRLLLLSCAGDVGLGLSCSKSGSSVPDDCWSLPQVQKVRLMPAPGREEAVVGARIMGSNTGPTLEFEELAEVTDAPEAGEWVELELESPLAFRYVKYHSPAGSHGAIAEVQFLGANEQLLKGEQFGTAAAPSSTGSVESAFDEDTTTFYEGGTASGNYVGLDLAADHVTAVPSVQPQGGAYPEGERIRITAGDGARLLYSWDGSDPREDGEVYREPLSLPAGESVLRVAAQGRCEHASDVVAVAYQTRAGEAQESVVASRPAPSSASSMHIGNSLTDTLIGVFPALVQSHGASLDFQRYTVPGAGLWLYERAATGGFGVDDVRETLRSRPFDHLVMQPYPNMPCQPKASDDGNDSDAGYILQAWEDAATQNEDVQVWIYQQWPVPQQFTNCITGGEWTRADWQPPAPESFADAVANELSYDEAIRTELLRLRPQGPEPLIIPAGSALVALQAAVERGELPGFGDFFTEIFELPADDDHVTAKGAYFVSEVFYASMFQAEPEATPMAAQAGLTQEQAAVMRRIAWDTVREYSYSGVSQ